MHVIAIGFTVSYMIDVGEKNLNQGGDGHAD